MALMGCPASRAARSFSIEDGIVDERERIFTRRTVLKGASAIAASGALSGWPARAEMYDQAADTADHPDITGRLSTYMSEAADRDLPPDVEEKTKQHILDTITAMVSGAELPPAETALRFVHGYGRGR